MSKTQTKFDSKDYLHWNELEYDTKSEKYLVDFLHYYPEVVLGQVYASTRRPEGVTEDWDPPVAELLSFSHLINAAEAAFDSKKRSRSKPVPLYTKETANDFHAFIFASFVTCTRSLYQFSRLAGQSSLADMESKFPALQGLIELLLFLITSSTFRKHIEVLDAIDGINNLVPRYEEKETYEEFGEFMQMWKKRSAKAGGRRTADGITESGGSRMGGITTTGDSRTGDDIRTASDSRTGDGTTTAGGSRTGDGTTTAGDSRTGDGITTAGDSGTGDVGGFDDTEHRSNESELQVRQPL